MAGSEKPYIPPPSIGHELGIMFGFIGLMLLAMIAYTLWWRVVNKRALARESDHVRSVRAQGIVPSDEKAGLKREG